MARRRGRAPDLAPKGLASMRTKSNTPKITKDELVFRVEPQVVDRYRDWKIVHPVYGHIGGLTRVQEDDGTVLWLAHGRLWSCWNSPKDAEGKFIYSTSRKQAIERFVEANRELS